MAANLTLNREKFVVEYLATGNASAALRAAYPKAAAWKPESVRRRAHEIMKDSEVLAAIREARADAAREARVDRTTVLQQLVRMVFYDVRTVLDAHGNVLPPSQWPDAVAMAVSGIEVREEFENVEGERVLRGYVKRIRFAPRDQALNMMFKHLGLYDRHNSQKTAGNPFEDVPVEVLEQLLELIRASRARQAN